MKDLFRFIQLSSSERKGALVLLILLIILQTALHLLPEEEEAMVEASLYEDFSSFIASYEESISPDLDLQPFNPNVLDIQGWENLGLSQKQASSIIKYRGLMKGFYSEDDLGSSFLIDSSMIARWRPFFIWEKPPKYPVSEASSSHSSREELAEHQTFRKEVLIIELNAADSAELTQVRGIGPSTASRIVKFRNSIGGFHSLDQLSEVWGFREENRVIALEQLVLDPEIINSLCINQVDQDQLSNHPYIRHNLARVIIAYRNEHGPFQETEDLLKTRVVTDSIFNKIKPYVDLCK